MSDPVLRRASPDDLPEIVLADARAFGITYEPQDVAEFAALFDPERFLLATDAGRLVGTVGDFPFTMTLPGGGQLDLPGLTWVSVALSHRRRGLLRALMAEQHHAYARAGVVASVLTASEGGIYGRFGYGPATVDATIEIDRRVARFRGSGRPGEVRYLDGDEVRHHASQVHERWRARTPGGLSRHSAWWDVALADRPSHRGGGSSLFHLAHDDGYAAYRIEDGSARCRVVEEFAATDDAHAALWRALLSLDLVTTIVTDTAAPGDPLPFLLTDGRQVRTTSVRDGMWARLIDVRAALAARTYAVEIDTVVEVDDPFLDSGGRFRLRGDPDGATCEPTTALPVVHAGVAALGSAWLGGHRLATLAAAGLAHAEDRGVLARLDAAFTTSRPPQHGTQF